MQEVVISLTNPGKREENRDKYLETDYFLAKKNKKIICKVLIQKEADMLGWALGFLIIALIAGVLGFGGIAGAAAGIAKIIFFIFLILLVISLIANAVRGRPPRM